MKFAKDSFIGITMTSMLQAPILKMYAIVLVLMTSLEAVKSYLWVGFIKDFIPAYFYYHAIIEITCICISYMMYFFSQEMEISVKNHLYGIYGGEMVSYRSDIKTGKDGRQWESKFSRFSRSVVWCIDWMLHEIFGMGRMVVDVLTLAYLSPIALISVVLIQIFLHAFYGKSHISSVTKARKTINDRGDDVRYSIKNMFSIFGLYGKDDKLLMDKIHKDSVDLDISYNPIGKSWKRYRSITKLIGTIPLIVLVSSTFWYYGYEGTHVKSFLLVIMTMSKITGHISNIVNFQSSLERWETDSHALIKFHKDNKGNIRLVCDQYQVPSNIEFSIDHTLRDGKRVFHLTSERRMLSIKKGQKVLLDGESGAGKSTLNKIICGHYEYGGTLPKYSNGFHSFYDSICEVSAGNFKSIEFTKSIREILSIIPETSEEVIWRILRLVCLDEWVREIGGLDIPLKEHASDGQKLRLSLATLLVRAYLRNSDIIILDEIDQNIQEEMAEKIVGNLFREFSDKTMVIVAHTKNIKRSMNFDSTIMIEKGKISQISTAA